MVGFIKIWSEIFKVLDRCLWKKIEYLQVEKYLQRKNIAWILEIVNLMFESLNGVESLSHFSRLRPLSTFCSANQFTGFYMIMASVMKELRRFNGDVGISGK